MIPRVAISIKGESDEGVISPSYSDNTEHPVLIHEVGAGVL